MKYVTVMGTSGKVIAAGELMSYNGRWMRIKRNGNEMIAVNTDFVQAIHFMELPTRGMVEYMARSTPIADDEIAQRLDMPPIAVKQTSARAQDPMQRLIESGPPTINQNGGQTGAPLCDLPKKVRVPIGVDLSKFDLPEKKKRGKHDSK